jgi:hypothetical protein
MKDRNLKNMLFLAILFSVVAASAHAATENTLPQNMNAMDAMALANEMYGRDKDVTTFVTPREVVFRFDEGAERKIPLPADRMLVAVAPYLTKTHKCFTHYMSGCQGQLPDTDFQVKAVDSEGKTLFDGNVRTLRNGFFELWLPRDRWVDLHIRRFDWQVQERIGTFDDSRTCVTTMKLQ